MSEGDAILAAILAEPGDPLHRLACADWLEENGREPQRARMIRGLPARGRKARWDEAFPGFMRLAVEMDAEVRLDGARARTGRRPSARDPWRLSFVRGFLEECSVPLGCWVRNGPSWLAAHPLRRAWASTWLASASSIFAAHHVRVVPEGEGRIFRSSFILEEPAPEGFAPMTVPFHGVWALMAGERHGVPRACSIDAPATSEALAEAVSSACIGWARHALATGR